MQNGDIRIKTASGSMYLLRDGVAYRESAIPIVGTSAPTEHDEGLTKVGDIKGYAAPIHVGDNMLIVMGTEGSGRDQFLRSTPVQMIEVFAGGMVFSLDTIHPGTDKIILAFSF